MRPPVAWIALLLLAGPGAAVAAATTCQGTISGAVRASFRCAASVALTETGRPVFEIRGLDRLENVPGYSPGAFELPEPLTARTYTLDDLGKGRASVAMEGGTLFTAAKTSSQRGEVTLVLKSLEKDPRAGGSFVAHGTYRARLLPAGGGKSGEVVVEVSF